MRTTMLTAPLLLLVLALAAPAQEPPPGADAKARLQELDWTIGTWTGSGEYEGKTYTSRIEYEWTIDGHFIESRYEASMEGQVIWRDRSMIGWDRAKEKLVWFTFGVDGTIGWGEHEPRTKEDTWVIVGSIPGDPLFEKNRSIIVREGPDRKKVTIQSWKDGDWVTFMDCTYERVAPEER